MQDAVAVKQSGFISAPLKMTAGLWPCSRNGILCSRVLAFGKVNDCIYIP